MSPHGDVAFSRLAVNPPPVLGDVSAAVAEAGVAIVGAAIAGLALAMLAAAWRRVLLSFRGRRAVGQVTRVDGTGRQGRKAIISFQAADGSDVTFRAGVPPRARVGGRLPVRYDPARPGLATIRSAASVGVRFLLPAGTAAAVGLTGVGGTLYTSSAGGFDAFFRWYATALLTVLALFCFFIAYLRHGAMAEAGMPEPNAGRTGRPGPAGPVFAAALVGAALLAGAVVLALGQASGS